MCRDEGSSYHGLRSRSIYRDSIGICGFPGKNMISEEIFDDRSRRNTRNLVRSSRWSCIAATQAYRQDINKPWMKQTDNFHSPRRSLRRRVLVLVRILRVACIIGLNVGVLVLFPAKRQNHTQVFLKASPLRRLYSFRFGTMLLITLDPFRNLNDTFVFLVNDVSDNPIAGLP